MRTFKVYCFKQLANMKCSIINYSCHLCITSPGRTHFVPGSLYRLAYFTHFTCLTSGNNQSVLWLWACFFFLRFYMWVRAYGIYLCLISLSVMPHLLSFIQKEKVVNASLYHSPASVFQFADMFPSLNNALVYSPLFLFLSLKSLVLNLGKPCGTTSTFITLFQNAVILPFNSLFLP